MICKSFHINYLIYPHIKLKIYYWPHFIDEDTEAWGVEFLCKVQHSYSVSEAGLSLDSTPNTVIGKWDKTELGHKLAFMKLQVSARPHVSDILRRILVWSLVSLPSLGFYLSDNALSMLGALQRTALQMPPAGSCGGLHEVIYQRGNDRTGGQ